MLIEVLKSKIHRVKVTAPSEARLCAFLMMKHERTKGAKRIERNNVSSVVDAAISQDSSRVYILVFLKPRSLHSLT